MITSPDPTPVTLRDVAAKLKVSHSTVSRALQNSPHISLARRQEIQEAAQKMGYRPHAVATLLGHQRHAADKRPVSSEVAWINCWPDPKRLRAFKEFNLYWKGASSRAEANGYRLEEFACNDQLSPSRLEQILLARNIHGVILPPNGGYPPPPGWEKVNWEKFCMVRFGSSVKSPCVHLVTSNHLTSGIAAIENMWRLGYKRIGFVGSTDFHIHFRAGFLLKQIHQVTGKPPIIDFLSSSASGEDQFSRLLAFSSWLKKNRPEAIFTQVPQTREMLIKLGYRVPEDIGLAATSILDGNADAGIDQNSEEIGRAAFETLLSLLNHHQYGIPKVVREVVITGTWVDGSSLPQR